MDRVVPWPAVALAKAAQRDVIQSCYHRLGEKPIHLGRNDWEWELAVRHSSFVIPIALSLSIDYEHELATASLRHEHEQEGNGR